MQDLKKLASEVQDKLEKIKAIKSSEASIRQSNNIPVIKTTDNQEDQVSEVGLYFIGIVRSKSKRPIIIIQIE